jgi:hypothetical protein
MLKEQTNLSSLSNSVNTSRKKFPTYRSTSKMNLSGKDEKEKEKEKASKIDLETSLSGRVMYLT